MNRKKKLFFKEKIPKDQIRRDFLVIIFISSFITSIFFYFSFLDDFQVISSNIPPVYITCGEEINKYDYVDCIIDSEYESIYAKIKIRGETNANRFKKGYRIILSEEKSMFGMEMDNDWLLMSMYRDISCLRTRLSFELWRSLQPTNPTAILIDSRYVRLYLNQKFQGLYLLAEKNDRSLFGLKDAQNSVKSSLIFQAKTITNFRGDYLNNWDQDWPNEEDGIYIKDEILTDLFNFVNNSDDNEFFDLKTGIYSKFDKLNLIDFFIFNFFILHEDFWHTNYFIIRDTYPSKFFLIPWDFDGSFCRLGRTQYDSDQNPELVIRERNELFNRLMDNENFRQDCNNRWKYLREELWTEEYILGMLSDFYEEIKDILEIEIKMWKPKITRDKDFNVYDFVKGLSQLIIERLEFCDTYFEAHIGIK